VIPCFLAISPLLVQLAEPLVGRRELSGVVSKAPFAQPAQFGRRDVALVNRDGRVRLARAVVCLAEGSQPARDADSWSRVESLELMIASVKRPSAMAT
jgi:hypothetical protein